MNLLEKVIAAKALEAHLKTLKAEIDTEARELFEPGDRKTVRHGDVKLGTITMSDPKATWKVVNREEWTAWVAENYPDALVTTVSVNPAWEAEYLKSPVDADGLIPDGLDQRTATPSWIVKPEKTVLAVLSADLPKMLGVGQ